MGQRELSDPPTTVERTREALLWCVRQYDDTLACEGASIKVAPQSVRLDRLPRQQTVGAVPRILFGSAINSIWPQEERPLNRQQQASVQ